MQAHMFESKPLVLMRMHTTGAAMDRCSHTHAYMDEMYIKLLVYRVHELAGIGIVHNNAASTGLHGI